MGRAARGRAAHPRRGLVLGGLAGDLGGQRGALGLEVAHTVPPALAATRGTTVEAQSSTNAFVRQFVHGLTEGPL